MQNNCVRKTGAVFFGGREIIRGNLTRAKSTSSITETRSIIKIAYVTVTLNKNITERHKLFNSLFSTIKIIKGGDIR